MLLIKCTYNHSVHGHNIPNILKGVNDNFTYRNAAGALRSITFQRGAYSLSDIYSYIQTAMLNNGDAITNAGVTTYSINFNSFVPTQSVQITLSNNYQVDFTPTNSIASVLGYGNVLLNQNQTYSSSKLVDILPTQSINILCNIANGFLYNGKISNVLYSFNNSNPRGTLIDKEPNPVVPCICNTKTIDTIVISFQDQNGKAITFEGEQFVVRLVIEQL